jgi:3-deoxy-D-manno-octulosonic-acid transferase
MRQRKEIQELLHEEAERQRGVTFRPPHREREWIPMTRYLLNVAYLCLLFLAAPWLIFQAIFRGKYREGFSAKSWGAVPQRAPERQCIWLHAVSVGEVNLLGVLLREIEKHRPDLECVISTTTKAGYDLARQKYAKHVVFYCPLDFSWAVRRAMRRIRPALLILAELELWPNLISAAKDHGAKVAIVNGRLSERSYRGYRRLRRWLRPTLDRLDLVAAQNSQYAERFCNLGVKAERVHVSGSLKFDGAAADRNNPRTASLLKLAGIADEDIIFLAGSTQQPEEQLAIEAFQALEHDHPNLKLIVVPRHPHRFEEVAELLDRSGLAWQRRSNLPSDSEHRLLPTAYRILLVDTVGELGAWWGTAAIGFVGGSLFSSRGGQNMIEPAAYGVATCFGPNTQNFRDVVEQLLSADAAVCVQSGEELSTFVRRCLEMPEYAQAIGERASMAVRGQQGATARTWSALAALLPARELSRNQSFPRRDAA